MQRFVLWEGLDAWRSEAASVHLTDDGVEATGTQLGLEPLPYRLDYVLDARAGFITRGIEVSVHGEQWARRIELTHDGAGTWRCKASDQGHVDLPRAGGEPATLAGALDCDLAFSPATNLMPIRRHALHERPEARDFVMAWISVPDLSVHTYPQRYEHVRRHETDSVVRFVDRGLAPGFVSELELDGDGLVVLYPKLARRVGR